jgi:hypothetical protein
MIALAAYLLDNVAERYEAYKKTNNPFDVAYIDDKHLGAW